MASSIAGTAMLRCPVRIASPSLLQPFCRFPDSFSFQLSLGSKQSPTFVGHLRPETLLPGQLVPGPAEICLFRKVECQQKQEKPDLVGSKKESGITESRKHKSGDGTKILAVAEGVCILVAGASYTASLIEKKQRTATVAASPVVPGIFTKFQDLSTWQVPALWIALVMNALLRTMQTRSSSSKTERNWEEKSVKDFTVDQRIGKLEDDVQSVAAIARMLSRHLEKLGVRFRVTRRTLRDPIQQTATLALKTSEVVSALATREETLEAELRETRRELCETQQLLVSMQDSQEKQLELLLTAVSRTLKYQKAVEEKLTKDSRRLAGTTNKAATTGIGDPSAKGKSGVSAQTAKSNFLTAFGGPKEGFSKKIETPKVTKMTNAQALAAERTEREKEHVGDNQNGRIKVTPSREKPEKKTSTFKPDTSFTKEDFWANTPSTSGADLSVEHEVVDYLTSSNRTTDAVSRYSDNPQGSGRLDSFFSGRKNINSYQAPFNLSTQDSHNPGFSSLHSQIGGSSSDSRKLREDPMGFSFDKGYGTEHWPSSDISSEVASGGISYGETNNWSNLSGGDSSPGSAACSPRQSSLPISSAWDFTSASGIPRNSSWYSASVMDCSSGSGSPRMGEGIINIVQAGFVDSDFMRDFKDGYISS